MTEQTAIIPRRAFAETLRREEVQERFREILDKRTPAFMASLLSVYAQNDALQRCSTSSILTSAAKAAILNLPIEPSLGFAHIVPFGKDAAFILGYKGLVQLALRTNQYAAINADAVYQGEGVEIDRLTGEITFKGTRQSDDIVGYFAFFRMKNGYEKYIYMTVEQVRAHAKRYAKSYGDPRSAWATNFDDMAKKTCLRQLLSKWGLLSIDMLDEDQEQLKIVGDDPRLTTPDLVVPTFDNVVDVPVTDAGAPEQTNSPDAVFQAIVDAGLSANVHAARITLEKYCHTGYATVDQGVTWFRIYREWRNMGWKPAEAGAKTDNGEVPPPEVAAQAQLALSDELE